MTTFSRLALVIQGKIKPCNWIERAFITVINALKLPAVGANDKGKYLHTNDSTGNLEWGAINEMPAVESADKGKYLHANESTGDLEWVELPVYNGGVS